MKPLLLALAATSALALAAPTVQAQPRHDDHRFDHRGPGGPGPGGRHWRQGERLDNRYGAYAPVNDWRSRRLPPPRRGYHWVRSGDDYVQAALVGGLIASVIAASR